MFKTSCCVGCFFLIALVFAPCLFSQPSAKADFEKTVKDMDDMFKKTKTVEEPRNQEIFNFISDKLKKGKIAVAFTKGGSSFESISFSPAGIPTLTIDEQALKNHKQGFSLTMSLLVNAFNRIYVYYANQNDFNKIMDTKLTRHVIDADSYYLMGMFIKEYVVPSGFKVTQFEDFIRDRIVNNDLDSVAGALLLENTNIMNSVYKLYVEYTSLEALDKALNQLFEEECKPALAKLRREDLGEYERFFDLMILRSFYLDGLDILFLVTGKRYDIDTVLEFGGQSGKLISACGVSVQLQAKFIDMMNQKMRARIGLPY